MSLTRQQIDGWNPDALTVLADAWCTLASSVEGLFERYTQAVVKVEGEYWEGTTAEAVQDRASSDHKTAIGLADRVEALAGTMRQGFHAIDGPLRRARELIAYAQEQCFVVTDGLAVLDPASDPDREPIRAALQEDLLIAAQAAEAADRDLEQNLDAAREGLRIVFTAAAALGSDQGRRDATALTEGTLAPEAARRLVEAGALTPEQLAGVQSGATVVIPASQMEYLNTISRSLDGRSPEEIDRLVSSLPPDARTALSNTLQLISTDTLTVATSGDPEVPTHGSLDLLPDGIREALTRDDLVVTDIEVTGDRVLASTELNGVADNQAIARIVAAGDADYRNGTALDRGLLEVGRQYLDAQVTHLQHPDAQFRIFTVDGSGTDDLAFTEPIFAAVADDRAAVEQIVTDPGHGGDFVRDVLVHQWPDDGKAVSALFAFDESDSTVTDPGDPVDVADARRSGAVMSAVAHAMSADSSWKLLSNIPATDGESIGQVNADLVRTVSHSMSPYIPHLAGANPENLPGFDTSGWADPKDNNSFRGSANVFAALNTDEEAGRHFLGRAYAETAAAETRYGQDPHSPGTTGNLTTAGRILGLSDRGLMLATQDQFHDQAEQQKEAYDRKSAAYDAVLEAGSYVLGKNPVGEIVATAFAAGGDPLEEMYIGKEPDPEQQAQLNAPNFYDHYYLPLAAADEIPLAANPRYAGLVDGNGALLPYDELLTTEKAGGDERKLQAFLREMFNGFGVPDDGHGDALRDGYDDVVRANG
ncbi:hypothetical protein F8M49_14240 [Rhodococcus zopfii]|uniref:TPR repeat domain-containing protein n=1 Tax=Rhodococcus zopfii TaxID=43772 RepID=A0ABU3WQF1_9NOCA|nr:hypothetical protein [Rhodococcus zopfii]